MTAPESLKLGQRVRFAATLRRTAQNAPRELGQWPNRRMKVWKRGDYLGELNPGEGIVVGLRTLYDGFVDWVYEVGYEFSPTQAHRAVLIATDMRHRPVLAFREDVEPVERRDDKDAVEAVLGVPVVPRDDTAYWRLSAHVENALAPVLGYEYDEAVGWNVGEHTAESLVMAAASRTAELVEALRHAHSALSTWASPADREGAREHVEAALARVKGGERS